MTFSNAKLTTTATYDVYSDTWGVVVDSINVTTGTVVVTFDKLTTDVNIKLRVS